MSRSADLRARELAAIHVARRMLGLDEETYRLMLWTVARVHSAADLDHAGRQAVLDHLRARGFRPSRPGRPRAAPERAALIGKIRALLIAGGHRPDAYADAMARRMFGVDRYEWLAARDLRRLVAALEIDRRRRLREAGGKEDEPS